MLRFTMQLVLVLMAASAPLCGQAPERPAIAPPTPEDIAAAMRDSVWGWFAYRSAGTAAGDSARRFAALGVWDLEGGDRARGLRLVHAAREWGIVDSTFYMHAGLFLASMRVSAEALALYEAAAARWPR